MPIKQKLHKDGTVGLVAICDVCGAEACGEDASILWTPVVKELGPYYDFRIACKRWQCTKTLDQAHGRQHSTDLDVSIGYLINNTKTDIKEARRKMRMIALIG